MPMGAVSLQTYNSIFSARSFDRYGKIKSNKLSEKEKMIADLQATFANQASAALADDEGTAGVKSKKGSAVEELKTPTWKIGYKKTEYGPPGEREISRKRSDELKRRVHWTWRLPSDSMISTTDPPNSSSPQASLPLSLTF